MYYCFKVHLIGAVLAIAWYISSGVPAFALGVITEASYLTVVNIEGPVLYWPPMTTTWEDLKVGERIYGEALIQATKSAKIIVKRTDPSGKSSEDLTLNMTGPTILRLRSKLNRKIVLTSFSMSTDRSDLPIGSGLIFKATPAKNLPTAWERVKQVASLLLNLSEEDISLMAPKEAAKAVSVSSKPKSFILNVPVDGSAYMVESFPTHIPVSWQEVDDLKKVSYVDITIENERTKHKLATLRTDQKAIAIPIPEAGMYKISVSASQEFQEDIESSSITVESPEHQLE